MDSAVIRRISWIVPAVIAAVTATALLIWQLQIAGAKEAVFQSLMRELSRQIEGEFARIFEPVSRNLLVARKWGKEGLLNAEQPADLNARFMPILQQLPQISSVQVAGNDGREFMLIRWEDEWQTRRTDVERWGERTLWNRWTRPSESVEEWWRETGYDPRDRPWFQGAMSASDDSIPHWTEPYLFLTARQPGITAAIRWQDSENPERKHVVAFDVLLSDIAAEIDALSVGDTGRALVIGKNGQVVGMNRRQRTTAAIPESAAALPAVADLAAGGIVDAVAAWESEGRAANDPFSYRSGGATWWAGFRPYRLGDQPLWLGIVLPEAELLARVGGPYGVTPIAIGLLGALAAVGSFLLLRRTRGFAAASPTAMQVLHGPPETTSREELTALIRQGESDRLEFKSTVRFNLRTGKPGKEIEQAWLKSVVAYLNTDGGTVLFGVEDDGNVVGLDRDGFANDDKCLRHIDNLITDRVGSEHAPYITLRIVSITEGKVAAIQVRRAQQPAFLRVGTDEHFYIRSGPATRKLPPSRILAYLQAREGD